MFLAHQTEAEALAVAADMREAWDPYGTEQDMAADYAAYPLPAGRFDWKAVAQAPPDLLANIMFKANEDN